VKPLVLACTAAAALLLTGCRTAFPGIATAEFFPIGLYCVERPEDFAAVRAAGFNVISGPATEKFFDSAQSNGLKVLATPGTTAGPHFNPARASKTIISLGAHPALWAWYLVDEPDLNLISPAQVQAAQDFVKSHCPAKPTALVIYKGENARDYANLADITMIDRYPIPWLPLANFGQHIEMARLALPTNKPLIAVIQAFDWNTDRANLGTAANAPLRAPTEAELRCMTYDALARGANGLFYFAFDTGFWKIREHAEVWDGLRRVVGEVNERLPMFRAEQLWWPRRVKYAEPAHRFNAALQSAVTTRLLRVRSGNGVVPAGDYILAVNTTERVQGFSFMLPPENSEAATVPVLGEARSVVPAAGWVADEFAPLAVHIYGPLK